MKKILFIIAALALMATSCKKKVDEFQFSGTVVDAMQCTGIGSSISEMDFGYVVALDTPDSVGIDYYNKSSQIYHNAILLYGTRTRFKENEKISGRCYFDDTYASSYCNYRIKTGLPEAVCSKLN